MLHGLSIKRQNQINRQKFGTDINFSSKITISYSVLLVCQNKVAKLQIKSCQWHFWPTYISGEVDDMFIWFSYYWHAVNLRCMHLLRLGLRIVFHFVNLNCLKLYLEVMSFVAHWILGSIDPGCKSHFNYKFCMLWIWKL